MTERYNLKEYVDSRHLTFKQSDQYRTSLKCVCKHKFFPWHNEKGECHANKTNGQQCTCIEFIPGI